MTSVNELGDIQVCYLFSEIWQSWEMSEEFFISLQIISLKLPKTCCLKLYFKIRQTAHPVWLLISLADWRLGFREMSSKCEPKVLRCIFLLWKVSQSHWLSVWRSLTENRAAVWRGPNSLPDGGSYGALLTVSFAPGRLGSQSVQSTVCNI